LLLLVILIKGGSKILKIRRNRKGYYTTSNQALIASILRWFALRMTKRNSLLKVLLQLRIEGSKLLKIYEFLSYQMLQHMTIIISKAKGSPLITLILFIALLGCNHEGMMIPICCQQFFANGHRKNKCQRLSSLANAQFTHIEVKVHALPP
jgi:hypothetical protein